MHKTGRLHISMLLALVCSVLVQVNAEEVTNELTETSSTCLQCHGKHYYSFENTFTDATERKRMNPYLIIDSVAYQTGEHGAFSCDDCHSPDYATYPHNSELKLEFKYSCMDCHGGDPQYEHLFFDQIAEEAAASVHAERMGDAFKCEMCHDPHTNKLVATTRKFSIPEIVAHNNTTCLQCHADESRYHIFTDAEQPKILETHSWLPNQSLHFKNVRCIECHTSKNDTMLVAHNILPKEQAIKNCAECHSKDGILQAKLFKYLSIESRSEEGIASSLKNEAYVIGANRNPFLNVTSIIIFGLTLAGIFVHIIARIIKRR